MNYNAKTAQTRLCFKTAFLLGWMGLSMVASNAAPAASAQKTYQVVQTEGVWWLSAPGGERLFSFGADCVGRGARKESYSKDRPEYASFLYYKTDEQWAKTTLKRLRDWKFNTLGGWSETSVLKQGGEAMLPYTIVLHLGASTLAPWCDMFDPAIAKRFDEIAKEQIEKVKNDPLLIGYFPDNEIGWWDDTMFLHFLGEPKENHTRQALMKLLRSHYKNDFEALKRDFNAGEAKSFDDLDQKAQLTLRPNSNGMQAVNAFLGVYADQYYKIAKEAIRKSDPQRLILGDRYAGWYPQEVARAAGRHNDVISINSSADWLDGESVRFALDALYALTKKPILIGEFYFCAMENRSGNKNSSANFPTVKTQKERAKGFETHLRDLASLPYVIGAHWFQYHDEPTHGRGDGEDYNMGMVDIHDQPYEEITAASRSLDTNALHKQSGVAQNQRNEQEKRGVLPAAPAKPEGGLIHWNKARAFVPSVSKYPFGDLYACWSKDKLYLSVIGADFAEKRLYENGVMPDSEKMTFTVQAGDQTIKVRFGNGGEASIEGIDVPVWTWNASTRFTAMIALPASLFGQKEFKKGAKIRLNAELASHSRAEQMNWDRTLTLEKAEKPAKASSSR